MKDFGSSIRWRWGRLKTEFWYFRRRWFCKIWHWRHRTPTFGGYGFGGRTDRQTGIFCSKCHTSYVVPGWQKAVVVKLDSQIQKERDEFGIEQLTPPEYWHNRKWTPQT